MGHEEQAAEDTAERSPAKGAASVFSKLSELAQRRITAQVIERLPLGLNIVDQSTLRLIYANPQYAEVLGWPLERVSTYDDFITALFPDPVSQEKWHAQMLADVMQRKESVFQWEHLDIVTQQGEPRTITMTVIPMRDLAIVVSLFRDETEACRAENALRMSEAKYRRFVQASPFGMHMYRLEPDGRLIFDGANPAADAILKVDNHSLIGMPIEEAFPQLIPTTIPDEYRRVCREGKFWHTEAVEYRDDRLVGAYEVHAFQTEPGQMMVLFADITERRRAEDALQHDEARLESLLRISQHKAKDVQSLLEYALEEAIQLTQSKIGYIYHYYEDRRQFVLNTWSKEVMKECQIVEAQTVYDLDKTGIWGEVVRQRKPIILNDYLAAHPLKKGYPEGHAPLLRFLSIPVFVGEEIVAVLGVANRESDYTSGDVRQLTLLMDSVWRYVERKRAEEERLRLDAQVQQAQKLESLGVLAGGIAHDFNNMLMAILGNADLALEDLSEVSPARPMLEEIERTARRAADLCRQMLAYSGRGHFIVKPVDLSEVVLEMTHMLEVSISKNVVLRYRLSERLPVIEADVTQVRQIIMNLIINASEAIGERSGVVSVTTGVMHCDRGYLNEFNAAENLPDGHYVFLEVADTGCGMDPLTVDRIFDPFFTTKFTGRGLGLAAVLGIVRGHRGGIKVYSELGRGTTFKVLFPAIPDAVPPETAAEEQPEKPWHGSGTVLLVDDEETVRMVGVRMLERLGFTVLVARDGREAIEVYKRHASEIACVLLDLTMPHMGGEDAFRELRRINPSVRVIMSSGYHEQEVTTRFSGKGLTAFMQKPYRLASLSAALRSATAKDHSST